MSLEKTLSAALEYASKGWRVFPLRPGGKEPLPGTNGVLDASTDPLVIAGWWWDNPDANLGIALDSDRCVVDVDVTEAHSGEDSLPDDLQLLGDLGATPVVRTPRGGRHIYLRAKGVRNSAGKLGPGLDTRGDRGYVVAPPSVVNGKPYVWEVGLDTGLLPWDPPAFLVEAPAATVAPGVGLEDDPADIAYVAAWIDNHAPRCVDGSGASGTLFSIGARIREYGVTADTAVTLLLNSRWNAECTTATGASYPWDEDELAPIIARAYRYAQNPPGIRSAAASKAAFAEVPPPPRTPSGNRFLDAVLIGNEVMEDVTEPTWLVKGVVPSQGVGAIAGREKVGKTFISLDLALHVACGRPWNGHEVEQAPVLYIAGEYGSGVRRRALAWAQSRGEKDLPRNFYLLPVNVRLHDDADFADLTAAIAKLPERPRLIILDTLTRSMAGLDYSKAGDAAMFTQRMDALARSIGGVVLGVGHTAKGKADAPSLLGSVVLQANVDFVLFADRPEDDDYIELRLGLSRDSEGGVVLAWRGEDVLVPGWSEPGRTIVPTERKKGVAERTAALGAAAVDAAKAVLDAHPGMLLNRDTLAAAVAVRCNASVSVVRPYLLPTTLPGYVSIENTTPRLTVFQGKGRENE